MSREDTLHNEYKIYQGSGEWSALYINGRLDYAGDHSNVEERIHELFEIEVECSDSFMLGNRNAKRDDVAKTEAAIEAYDNMREGAQRRLEELQRESELLRKEFNLR